MSHLLQMRGLKRKTLEGYRAIRESHLLQMRGLKLCLHFAISVFFRVASFTDAWIETGVSLLDE